MLKYHVAVCDDEKSDLDGIVQSVQQYDVQGCFDIETYMDSCCLFQCWRYASLKHGSVQQVVLVLNLPACAPCEPFLQVPSSQNSASSFTSIVLYRSGE